MSVLEIDATDHSCDERHRLQLASRLNSMNNDVISKLRSPLGRKFNSPSRHGLRTIRHDDVINSPRHSNDCGDLAARW
jgi:hypothetical protein